MNDKKYYETPSIKTFAIADIISALGSAQGMSSGVSIESPGANQFFSPSSNTNRHIRG